MSRPTTRITNQPTGHCSWCGVALHTGKATCYPCRKYDDPAAPSDAHALVGGRWITRGLVRVWEAA